MKSTFWSLDEIISRHIERRSSTNEVPMGSPSAISTAKNQPFISSTQRVSGVLQWGFSTWGVEPVIGVDAPQNRK